MNEKLEAFRRRLHSGAPPKAERLTLSRPRRILIKVREMLAGISVKDWITITLSSVALMLSALTAYRTALYRADALRVHIEGPSIGQPVSNAKPAYLTLSGQIESVFVNTGNQNAIVRRQAMRISNSSRCALRGSYDQYIATDLEPLLVRQGDVTVARARLVENTDLTDDDRSFLKPRPDGTFSVPMQDELILCANYKIITPHSAVSTNAIIAKYNPGTGRFERPVLARGWGRTGLLLLLER